MSPTMSEGNITAWKVKEGSAYSAGDVLLEIETDKAQMDVEAQEDGVLAKIMHADGSKAIKVGSRIAVMAEEGDDLASLEIPPDESTKSAEKEGSSSTKESAPAPPKQEAKPEPSQPKREAPREKSGGKPQEQHYPLYPSVVHLLHTNNIPLSDASKIPATGPSGRLLKGDVLSYLNAIPANYAAEQSSRIEHLSHLDLSSIKIAPQKPAAAESKEAAPPPPPEPTEIAVPISLSAVLETQRRLRSTLGIDLPLSTFIARASEMANEALPRARAPPSADELFDAVVGAPVPRARTSRGHFTPMITALAPPDVLSAPPSFGRSAADAAFDDLVGAAPRRAAVSPRGSGGRAGAMGVLGTAADAANVFSVQALPGDEVRARTYLERVKSVLEAEPGRCVL